MFSLYITYYLYNFICVYSLDGFKDTTLSPFWNES